MIVTKTIQYKIQFSLIVLFLATIAILLMPVRTNALLGDATNQIPKMGRRPHG